MTEWCGSVAACFAELSGSDDKVLKVLAREVRLSPRTAPELVMYSRNSNCDGGEEYRDM